MQSKAIIDGNFLYQLYTTIIIIMIMLPKPAAHSKKRSIMIIGKMPFILKRKRVAIAKLF